MKPPADLPINWFDFLVAVVLLIGIARGKKRGMSQELLDVLQWLLIVVVAALGYKHLGDLLSDYTHMGPLAAYITCYVGIAVVIKLIFSAIKRAVGEKLVQADTFGGMEYYLGMVAGCIRFGCVLLVGVSLLHAKFISLGERMANRKMQSDNFGTISFPTLASVQDEVFKGSSSGKFIRRHLREQLIHPTPAGSGPSIKLPHERDLEEVLGK